MRWKSALWALVAGMALGLAATAPVSAKTMPAPAPMSRAAAQKTRLLLPTPKQATSLKGEYTVGDHTNIVVDGHATKDEMDIAKQLSDELHTRTNTRTHIIKRVMPHSIRLHLVKKWGQVNKYYHVDVNRDLGTDGYILVVTRGGVIVVATTPAGLHNGTRTLLQLLKGHKVPAIRISDWPDIKGRMVLYDQRDNTVNVQYWQHWIGSLSDLKVNQIMPFFEDDFQYANPKYSYLGKPNTWNAAKAKQVVDYAHVRQMQVIPQLESFGHADGLLAHQQLFNLRQAGKQWEYSPCTAETYEVFNDLYGELSKAFPQSKMFHVGSDEVGGWEPGHLWGFKDDQRCDAAIASKGEAQIFVDHLHKLQSLLAFYGRDMAMWGDEILNHPELASKLNKDITIFDWHYEDTKDFPSLQKFKDWGFKHIYAAPAVHGFNDLYPMYPISFGNIPAFSHAASQADIDGVCITMWGMIEGGNAENYLYGMAYAAQVMWSSDHTDIADFNRRFAYQWFGIDDPAAADHVDRMFWWPWRVSGSAAWDKKDYTGYWQNFFTSTGIVFGSYNEIAKDLTDAELTNRIAESKELLDHVAKGRASYDWVKAHATRNEGTLEAMDTVLSDYEHMARKAIAVYQLALDYRHAVAQSPQDTAKLQSILQKGIDQVNNLRFDYIGLRLDYLFAIDNRNGDPRDMTKLTKVQDSLNTFVEQLRQAQADIAKGKPAPTPAELGLSK